MSWIADTSWLYALVDNADPHHEDARSQAKIPAPVEIPQAIMAETLDLIRYRHGKKAAIAALVGYEALPHFAIQDEGDHAATAVVWRQHEGLTYADATAVAAAKRRGFGLRSFDRRQVRALGPRS